MFIVILLIRFLNLTQDKSVWEKISLSLSLSLSRSLSLSLCAEIVNYEFDTKNLVCLLISSVVGVWYLFKKVTSETVTGKHNTVGQLKRG